MGKDIGIEKRDYQGEGVSLRTEKGEIDYILLSVVIVLYGIGIIMVFSASINEGLKYGRHYYFLNRQAVWLCISFLAFVAFIFIDSSLLERLRKPLIWIIIFMLVMLLVPVFVKIGVVHPSRRWFRIGGVGFQPSEFAKIVLLVYLASILSNVHLQKLRLARRYHHRHK